MTSIIKNHPVIVSVTIPFIGAVGYAKCLRFTHHHAQSAAKENFARTLIMDSTISDAKRAELRSILRGREVHKAALGFLSRMPLKSAVLVGLVFLGVEKYRSSHR